MQGDETASHVVCDCKDCKWRLCGVGMHFMQSVDCDKVPLSKVLHYIQDAGPFDNGNYQ
jgi:hypothetical protein